MRGGGRERPPGAQAGYGGTVLYTRDMPIIVSLENQGADFSGTVSVDVYASEMDFDRYEASVQLAAARPSAWYYR